MKITNSFGLPKAVFDTITNKVKLRDGDISVTELIDSPRVRVLKKKHDHEVVQDASTLLAATLGTALHAAIEKGTKTGEAERRLKIKVRDWTLSGGMDHYEDGILTDYKTCNVFKVTYAPKGVIDDWEKQLNVYAHILRENGFPVFELKIFALFKDWNRRGLSSAQKSNKLWIPWEKAGYPEKDWAYINVPLWLPERAAAYIGERVKLHQDAEHALPLCSQDDIWNGTRCSRYCAVAPFCDQYKKQSTTGLIETESA